MKRNVLLARGAQLAGLIDALDFRLAQRAGEPREFIKSSHKIAHRVADFGAAPENLTNGNVRAVPEPGNAALLFGGILTLLGLRRLRA